ncbi:hypothetical protein BGZ46_004603 [Entomortierella lignicola]|nr:hypothetical protein BGZ46_004603 [Entomortierella lignicola]
MSSHSNTSNCNAENYTDDPPLTRRRRQSQQKQQQQQQQQHRLSAIPPLSIPTSQTNLSHPILPSISSDSLLLGLNGSSSGSIDINSSQLRTHSRESSVALSDFRATPAKVDRRGKGKGHVFTPAQEMFIAELLSDPETWKLLDGPREKNDHYRSKTQVYENFAHKLNTKFSTETAPIELCGLQVKNKIENMKKQWKSANALVKRTGSGDLPGKTLEEQVKEICSFYYVLEDTFSGSFALNRRPPVQLTRNLIRPNTLDASHDTDSDSNDESTPGSVLDDHGLEDPVAREESVAVKDPIAVESDTTVTSERLMKKNTSSKRHGNASDLLQAVDTLSKDSAQDRAIKRKKLELDAAKDKRDEAKDKRDEQMHSIDLELRQVDLERARIGLRLEQQKAELALELEKARVKAEIQKLQREGREISCSVERNSDSMILTMRSSASPPRSPRKRKAVESLDS